MSIDEVKNVIRKMAEAHGLTEEEVVRRAKRLVPLSPEEANALLEALAPRLRQGHMDGPLWSAVQALYEIASGIDPDPKAPTAASARGG